MNLKNWVGYLAATKLGDAPNDGSEYVRQNAAWVLNTGGSGGLGGITADSGGTATGPTVTITGTGSFLATSRSVNTISIDDTLDTGYLRIDGSNSMAFALTADTHEAYDIGVDEDDQWGRLFCQTAAITNKIGAGTEAVTVGSESSAIGCLLDARNAADFATLTVDPTAGSAIAVATTLSTNVGIAGQTAQVLMTGIGGVNFGSAVEILTGSAITASISFAGSIGMVNFGSVVPTGSNNGTITLSGTGGFNFGSVDGAAGTIVISGTSCFNTGRIDDGTITVGGAQNFNTGAVEGGGSTTLSGTSDFNTGGVDSGTISITGDQCTNFGGISNSGSITMTGDGNLCGALVDGGTVDMQNDGNTHFGKNSSGSFTYDASGGGTEGRYNFSVVTQETTGTMNISGQSNFLFARSFSLGPQTWDISGTANAIFGTNQSASTLTVSTNENFIHGQLWGPMTFSSSSNFYHGSNQVGHTLSLTAGGFNFISMYALLGTTNVTGWAQFIGGYNFTDTQTTAMAQYGSMLQGFFNQTITLSAGVFDGGNILLGSFQKDGPVAGVGINVNGHGNLVVSGQDFLATFDTLDMTTDAQGTLFVGLGTGTGAANPTVNHTGHAILTVAYPDEVTITMNADGIGYIGAPTAAAGVTANNSFQLGEGTNALANSSGVGDITAKGLRIIGDGVAGTVDGEFWRGAVASSTDVVYVESGGETVQLVSAVCHLMQDTVTSVAGAVGTTTVMLWDETVPVAPSRVDTATFNHDVTGTPNPSSEIEILQSGRYSLKVNAPCELLSSPTPTDRSTISIVYRVNGGAWILRGRGMGYIRHHSWSKYITAWLDTEDDFVATDYVEFGLRLDARNGAANQVDTFTALTECIIRRVE